MPRTGMTSTEIKEKSLDVAEILIRKYGFEKIRLVDIAKELKVSHVALYNHFPDKSALLDGVSERWLDIIDETLEKVIKKNEPANELIIEWFVTLHQLKIKKVLNDPELHKAFDIGSVAGKPFVIKHMNIIYSHLNFLVQKGFNEKIFNNVPIEKIVQFLFESTLSFHHPKLVLDKINENRESDFRFTLELLLKGLK